MYWVMTECRLVGSFRSLRSSVLHRNVCGLYVYQTLHGVIHQKNIIMNPVPEHPVSIATVSGHYVEWNILNSADGFPPSVGSLSSALSGSCILYGTTLEELLVLNQPTWAFTLNYNFPEKNWFYLPPTLSPSPLLLLLSKEMSREIGFSPIRIVQHRTVSSQLTRTSRTNYHIYTLLPPDDGQPASPKHVEV
jgi:hypothetical protein